VAESGSRADEPHVDVVHDDEPPLDEPRIDDGAVPGGEPLLDAPAPPAPPGVPPIVDVADLDWIAIRDAVVHAGARSRMRDTVERMETLLDREQGPGLLFDADRTDANDRAIRVGALANDAPLWIIGDLHGDLLALEAALALVRRDAGDGPPPRLVFLGDLFDDGGYELEVLLRVFELILDASSAVCVLAGNHDEALGYNGAAFTATVRPSDFSEFLNAHLAHEWITRAGKLAVRLALAAPRALFFPDGLLVTHGGFPLVDLHDALRATRDWNDPRCLTDFTWTRAHPRARRKMPNRTSRGSQFGHEDFADFCALATELERPVTHMVRGHDHVDERFEIYPAYAAHPVLTTVALSRRLPRESFGPYARVPTIAKWVEGTLPQVHRLLVPETIVRELFPEEVEVDSPVATADGAT
jgi:Calcineurin-like phosphoesterase